MAKPQPLKNIPKDTEAEKHFLTAVIYEPERFEEAMSKYQLSSEDFFDERNRITFEFVQSMIAEGVKEISAPRILTMARQTGKDNLIDRMYIVELVSNAVNAIDATYYASVIKQHSQMRTGLSSTERFAEVLYSHPDEQSFNQALAQLENETHALIDNVTDTAHKGPRLAWDVYGTWYADAEERKARGEDVGGVKTGFTGLDNVITGLKPGTMNIIAAQPGVGKSALGINIMTNIAKNPAVRKPVMIFSLEMTAEQVVWRIVSSFTNIPVQKFDNFKLTDADKCRIQEMNRRPCEIDALHQKLYIDDDGYMTPQIMRQRCRRISERCGGLAAILVDHVQIMNGDRKSYNNDVTKYAEISRQLKIISKEFKCPVVVLSQLSRKIDDRKDHEPKNTDLKETSGLEQDADLIIFIQRDMSDPECGEARLKITKNRHGSLGEVNLAYIGKLTMFQNL